MDLGIHSIPTLLVDGGRFVVGGAARASEVEQALRRVIAEEEEARASGDARSCGGTYESPEGVGGVTVFAKSLQFD